MRRREFIAGLGGALARPLAPQAQQPDRLRRVGVLMGFDENDPEAKGWLSGFTQMLAELGWTDGRNVRMNVRWASGNLDRMRTLAKSWSTAVRRNLLTNDSVTAASKGTRTIPIIFVIVADPVGRASLRVFPARPNLTGFIS